MSKKNIIKESSGRYLTEQELMEVIEKILPALLKKKPELKTKLRALFGNGGVTREEVMAAIEELRKLREDMNKRFEAVDRRFEELREDMNKRFEAVDRRFEEMREDMNKRFEAVDKRFEAVDRRFKEMREDMNKRFEAVDKRFEELREDMNKRFEAVDRRFEEMREDMNKRFEAVDRRFEAVDKRFEQMRIDFKGAIESTVKALTARIDSTERLLFSEIENKTKQLSAKMDTIGSRWGILAEGSFRSALNELVKGLGFSVTKWKKRDDGKVFLYPRDVEIDILVKNAKTLAIEVKSSLTLGEVEDFERAVRFYEMNEGKKVDEKIILAIHHYPGVKEYASQMGIKIISEPEELS